MHIRSIRRAVQALAPGLLMALIVFAGAATPASAAEPPLTLAIDATPIAISAGESTNFQVTLKNSGAQDRNGVLLGMTLEGPVDEVKPSIISKDPNVATKSVRRRGRSIFWQGDLPAGKGLVINLSVAAKLHSMESTRNAIKLVVKAGPAGGEAIISVDKTVTVEFPPDVSHSDVEFKKVVVLRDGDTLVDRENAEVLSREKLAIELRLTNNSNRTIYSLLVDTLGMPETRTASADTAENNCRLNVNSAAVAEGRGFVVPLRALGEQDQKLAESGTLVSAFLVKTDPGQTSVTRVRGAVVGTPDCVLEGQARAHMTAIGPGVDSAFEAAAMDESTARSVAAPKLAFIRSLLDTQPKLSTLVKLVILLSEFGDAPDSTNHFAAAMDAYPGVQARFPTVFDPSTGQSQGPKHGNGHPLHLGHLVSGELIVDIGPGKDIDPPSGDANLDVHDDGIDTNNLSFDHCVTTDIPFEVTVTQKAVDHFAANRTTAYLNIWLDGNHNGDWEDSLLCGDLTAVEHIVIDQPIAPSAPGTYSLVAPTGNIPVPANGKNRTMWLRATISDKPSIKTGTFTNPGQPPKEYGDGRGPAGGFRWGETEDYLYSPWAATPIDPGDIIGPDLSIDAAETMVQTGTPGVPVGAAAVDRVANMLFLKAKVRNRGDRLAPGATLIVEMEPFGGPPPIVEPYASWCLTCIVASNVVPLPDLADAVTAASVPIKEVCAGNDCHLEIPLGDVPPGKQGEILLGWSWGESNSGVTFTTRVEGPPDGNAGNNSASSGATRLTRPPVFTSPPPGTLGWTGCLTCTRAFQGFGEPNSTLSIFSDGFESGNVSVPTDKDGFWQVDVKLKEGEHEVYAEYQTVNGATIESSSAEHRSAPLHLTVDPSLNWDPTSLGITKYDGGGLQAAGISESDDSCGPWHFLDDAGRADRNGWKIPVWPGRPVELGVDLICEGSGRAELNWIDVLSIDFKDVDGDGRYTANFTVPEIGDEVLVELTVACNSNSATYTGTIVPIEPATLVNAETGAPLRDGEIELWQRIPESDGRQWTPWDAQAYGQGNPQTTGDMGHFSFVTPAGAYGLTAQIDGFQPFRTGPFRLQGVFPSRTIALTPFQSGETVVQVRITEHGFDPPALEVAPGTVVEWLNTELGVAQVETAIPAAVAVSAADKGWDSGLMSTGQRYRQRFDQEGAYSYIDGENPSSQATVIVRTPTPEETGTKIFLPVIQ